MTLELDLTRASMIVAGGNMHGGSKHRYWAWRNVFLR